eukprot:1258859-Pyramimonas_sp.AAC.1
MNPERRTTCGPELCHVSSCSMGLNMRKLLARASASPSSSAPSAPCSSRLGDFHIGRRLC